VVSEKYRGPNGGIEGGKEKKWEGVKRGGVEEGEGA